MHLGIHIFFLYPCLLGFVFDMKFSRLNDFSVSSKFRWFFFCSFFFFLLSITSSRHPRLLRLPASSRCLCFCVKAFSEMRRKFTFHTQTKATTKVGMIKRFYKYFLKYSAFIIVQSEIRSVEVTLCQACLRHQIKWWKKLIRIFSTLQLMFS